MLISGDVGGGAPDTPLGTGVTSVVGEGLALNSAVLSGLAWCRTGWGLSERQP